MKRINLKQLKKDHQLGFFAVDALMLGLVGLNLLLIIVEWIYSFKISKEFLIEFFPNIFQFYTEYIHEHFLIYDFLFIVIYIVEFSIRWIIAIIRKTYHSWFFYPFIHWYDVLGCFPLDSLRIFRFLRVFSMVYRLERMGVINLSNTYLFKLAKKYYRIFVEEVSDAVVINVIDDMKQQVSTGSPIVNRVVDDVISPHKEEIKTWVTSRVDLLVSNLYDENKDNLKVYVDKLIKGSMEKNSEIMTLELVPVVGNVITSKIEKAISDIVFNVISGAIEDFSNNKQQVIDLLGEKIFEVLIYATNDKEMKDLSFEIFSGTLEILKEKVSEKMWQLEEIAEKQNNLREELEKEENLQEVKE
ncbi:MAG: ion transporter [Flammeovirgaceae bacterium]|nr:ion transporter [Flammeovirgaceae bacterium]